MTILDLTLTISGTLPSFPGSPKPQFIPWNTIDDDKYNLELLFLSSHSGTHLDAPFHFVKKGKKIHQIPISRFKGQAHLIKINKSKNKGISKNDILFYETKYGKIKTGSSVIIYTGWQKHLSEDYYFLENPGLTINAAKYLAAKKLNLVGIDSPSIDMGKNPKFDAHKIFAQKNILIVENLANLDKINNSSFDYVILPLKLFNATGSPVRAIALY